MASVLGKNVLVTGGAGFIGSHLCDALLGKGDKVICADNFSLGIRKNICSMEENENFILYETDAGWQRLKGFFFW